MKPTAKTRAPQTNHAGFILPPKLRSGDQVAVVAPAGPLRPKERELAERSLDLLRGWGLEPRGQELAAAPLPYLSAPDEERAAQLRWALTSPEIRGIFCLRGGYGSMRILPLLDPQWLREDPKVLLGFSDLTALLLGLGGKARVVTFHGPTLASSCLASGPHSSTAKALHRAIMEGKPLEPMAGEVWRPGMAEGPLVGGCLSLVVALVGTPFLPRLEGAVLFLEDVGEPLYRLDRMFQQLRLAGMLDGLAAVAIGHMGGTRYARGPLRKVVLEAVGPDVPVLAGLPCGHGRENLILPLGCWARLEGDRGRLVVEEAGVF